MSRKVTVRVSRAHAKWIKSGNPGDHARSQSRAEAARRLIRLWECLQEFAQEWISMDYFYMPKDRSQARWIRRNLYTLENAGLVELRMGRSHANQRITEVRIRRPALANAGRRMRTSVTRLLAWLRPIRNSTNPAFSKVYKLRRIQRA